MSVRALVLSILGSLGVWVTALPAVAQTGVYSSEGEESEDVVSIIAHPDVQIDDLRFDDLRALLLGKQRFWPGGDRVHLVIDGRSDSEARRVWIEEVTAMTDVQYAQYWIGMVFRGRATTAPHEVPDPNTAVALVAALPGSISIVQGVPSTEQVRILGVVEDVIAER